jgi:hypothetical protein
MTPPHGLCQLRIVDGRGTFRDEASLCQMGKVRRSIPLDEVTDECVPAGI